MDTKFEPVSCLAMIVGVSAICYGAIFFEWQSNESQGLKAFESHQYREAESCFKAGLRSANKLSFNKDSVVISLNNLAQLYADRGNLAAAESLYRRALAIRESELCPNHANLAASLNNLAAVLACGGKYEEAGILYQRALAITESKRGRQKESRVTNVIVNQVEQHRHDVDFEKSYRVSENR
ncbi:MAG: tetratricopeptide repeat protein [Candidatus Melainabacteria bacterium]|nr:tetratricopeptide repeat protein [Candidatus Melainabacteria bacterium]